MNKISSNVLLSTFLPLGADVVVSNNQTFILDADMDGDTTKEIIIGYRYAKRHYVMVLKPVNRQLKMVCNLMLGGSIISFGAYHITSLLKKEIVIGMSVAMTNQIFILGFDHNKYRNLLIKNDDYDTLEINTPVINQMSEIVLSKIPHRYLQGRLIAVTHEQEISNKHLIFLNQSSAITESAELPILSHLYEARYHSAHGEHWGYITNSGKWSILPHFDEARPFQSDGSAAVKSDGLYGTISLNGDWIIPPTYAFIGDVIQNRRVVKREDDYHIVDSSGHHLGDKCFPFIDQFKEERARYRIGSFYGYIDLNADEVIHASYMKASRFTDGMAVILNQSGEYALISPEGRVQYKYPGKEIIDVSENKVIFRTAFNNYGYLSLDGHILIDAQFSHVSPFYQNRAIVSLADKEKGLINPLGQYVFAPIYSHIENLGMDRIAIGKIVDPGNHQVLYALATIDGEQLTPFLFSKISDYQNGIASVVYENKTFLIDLKGECLKVFPVFEGSGHVLLYDHMLKATVDGRLNYYDFYGRVIYQENSILSQVM